MSHTWYEADYVWLGTPFQTMSNGVPHSCWNIFKYIFKIVKIYIRILQRYWTERNGEQRPRIHCRLSSKKLTNIEHEHVFLITIILGYLSFIERLICHFVLVQRAQDYQCHLLPDGYHSVRSGQVLSAPLCILYKAILYEINIVLFL